MGLQRGVDSGCGAQMYWVEQGKCVMVVLKSRLNWPLA